MEVDVNTFENSNHFKESLHLNSKVESTECGCPELDEKRRIRAVQEYLYRLYEVREWLINCIGEDAMPKIIELEDDLRNGVLLARIANYFAAELILLEKIFDLKKERYERDGLSYRHIDNIVAFRKAALSIHLPEVIIPETVDVYEGRNSQTIFCLYALAIRLFRLRKAPPIRNKTGVVQFTEDEFNSIKNRFAEQNQNLNFTNFTFGNLNKVLSAKTNLTISESDDGFCQINAAIFAKDSIALIESLKSFNNLCIEPDLADQYLLAFIKHQESLPNQKIDANIMFNLISEVNALECLKRLMDYLNSDNDNLNTIYLFLMELSVEQVMEISLNLYQRILKQLFKKNNNSITVSEVVKCVENCNACTRVKIASNEEDLNELFDALNDPLIGLTNTLNIDYKNEYGNAFFNTFKSVDLYIPEIQKIIFNIHNQINSPQSLFKKLYDSCEIENQNEFFELLQKIDEQSFQQSHLLPINLLMKQIREIKSEDLNILTIQECIFTIKKELNSANELTQWVFHLNKAVIMNNKNEILELLKSQNENLFKFIILNTNILGNRYISALSKAQYKKIDLLPNNLKCICENFSNIGNIIVNETNNQLQTIYMENISSSIYNIDKWALTRTEIKDIILNIKKEFDDFYKKSEAKICKAQRYARYFIKRRKNRRREIAAKKIQKAFRLHLMRKSENELKNATCPSLNCVRKFVTMLQDTVFDYDEDIKMEHMRTKVDQLTSQNEKLKLDVESLDNQIGLLIRNLISAQEAAAHKDQIDQENRHSEESATMDLHRKDKEKLKGLLGVFFFYLQTEPIYLLKLTDNCCFNSSRLSNPVEFFSRIISPSFNGTERTKREECLIVNLFTEILKLYVSQLKDFNEFFNESISSNSTQVAVLFSTLFRQFFSNLIVNAIEDELFELFNEMDDNFNLNPLEIYENIHKTLPENIQAAMTDSQVVNILEQSKSFVLKWVKRFTQIFCSELELPKFVIHFLQSSYILLEKKFDLKNNNNNEVTIERALALFLFQTYYNFFIIFRVDGDNFKIKNKEISPQQQNVLKKISNIIQIALSGKKFHDDVFYLQSMNEDLRDTFNNFIKFVKKIYDNNFFDNIYLNSELNALAGATFSTLKISPKNLQTILQLIIEYEKKIITDSASIVSHLLKSLRDCWKKFDGIDHIILRLRPISLNNASPKKINDLQIEEKSSSESIKELFIKTKKDVVSLLLLNCDGNNIIELLNDVDGSTTLNDLKLKELKQIIKNNLPILEENGLLSKLDNYQALINEIAKDIQFKTSQKEERLAKFRNLEKQAAILEKERIEYNSQLEKYKTCLESCIENMTSRCPTILLDGDVSKNEKQLKKRSQTQQNLIIKITSEKLLRKNLLADFALYSIASTTKNPMKMTLEISRLPDTRWAFLIIMRQPKTDALSTTVDIQDLIRAENEGQIEFLLFTKLRINPINFRKYLTKKFYNQK